MKKFLVVLTVISVLLFGSSLIGATNVDEETGAPTEENPTESATAPGSYTIYSEGPFHWIMSETGSATVVDYFGQESEVTVLSMMGGCPVNVIAYAAFSGTKAKKVYLPDCVMAVEDGAFRPAVGEEIEVVFNYNSTNPNAKPYTVIYSQKDDFTTESRLAEEEKPTTDEPTESGEEETPTKADKYEFLVDCVYKENGLVVRILNDGVSILSYQGAEPIYLVPKYWHGMPVKRIARGAFVGTEVKEVQIPHGITVEEGALGSLVVVLECDTENPIRIEPSGEDSEIIDIDEKTAEDIRNATDVADMTEAEGGDENSEKSSTWWIYVVGAALLILIAVLVTVIRSKTYKKHVR